MTDVTTKATPGPTSKTTLRNKTKVFEVMPLEGKDLVLAEHGFWSGPSGVRAAFCMVEGASSILVIGRPDELFAEEANGTTVFQFYT